MATRASSGNLVLSVYLFQLYIHWLGWFMVAIVTSCHSDVTFLSIWHACRLSALKVKKRVAEMKLLEKLVSKPEEVIAHPFA